MRHAGAGRWHYRFTTQKIRGLKQVDGKSLRATQFQRLRTVSYTHLRAHETPEHLVCRLLLEKKKKTNKPLNAELNIRQQI